MDILSKNHVLTNRLFKLMKIFSVFVHLLVTVIFQNEYHNNIAEDTFSQMFKLFF